MGKPATDQPLHSTNDQTNKTVSVNGQVYQILDVGYIYGNLTAACMILSDNAIIVNPPSFAATLCGQCWHPEGLVIVPDWVVCSIPVGIHGQFIKFKAPFECHCLKMVSYVSIDTGQIDPTVTFASMCGAPKVPPPLYRIGIAAGLVGAGALAALAYQKYVDYSGDTPPGFDSNDVNMGPGILGIDRGIDDIDGHTIPEKKCDTKNKINVDIDKCNN